MTGVTCSTGDASTAHRIAATNLHADILSDLAAALTGSLGVAPTANIDPSGRRPPMFEPIHGSAFAIAGKGIANPIGTFLSSAMMLDHLGEQRSGDRLRAAVETVTLDPTLHTSDLGGDATTAAVTSAVIAALAETDGADTTDRSRSDDSTS